MICTLCFSTVHTWQAKVSANTNTNSVTNVVQHFLQTVLDFGWVCSWKYVHTLGENQIHTTINLAKLFCDIFNIPPLPAYEIEYEMCERSWRNRLNHGGLRKLGKTVQSNSHINLLPSSSIGSKYLDLNLDKKRWWCKLQTQILWLPHFLKINFNKKTLTCYQKNTTFSKQNDYSNKLFALILWNLILLQTSTK